MEITQPDLFGGDTLVVEPKRSPYANWRTDALYRRAEDRKNCGNCNHSYMTRNGARRYRKCQLLGVSHSPATDVSNRFVCNHWMEVRDEKG
jgi:hypothetical protein